MLDLQNPGGHGVDIVLGAIATAPWRMIGP